MKAKDRLAEYFASPEYAAKQALVVRAERRRWWLIVGTMFLTAIVSMPIAAWLVEAQSVAMDVAFLAVWGGGFGASLMLVWAVTSTVDRSGAVWIAAALFLLGGTSLLVSALWGFNTLRLVVPLGLAFLLFTRLIRGR